MRLNCRPLWPDLFIQNRGLFNECIFIKFVSRPTKSLFYYVYQYTISTLFIPKLQTMSGSLEKVIQLIDNANASDPNNGTEALYARRMLQTLQSFDENASEPLTLACYAQHVCRWKLSRKDYSDGLAGYLKWRADLAKLHADILRNAMYDSGYDEQSIKRASSIIQKKRLKKDPDAQTLEDISCLVFLSYYFDSFAKKHPDDKIIDIVRKTWAKMSDEAHDAALKLSMSSRLQVLVEKALT